MSAAPVLAVAISAALGGAVGFVLGRWLGSDTPGFFVLLRQEQGVAYGILFAMVGGMGGLAWSQDHHSEAPDALAVAEAPALDGGGCR